jgi:glycolate oxidase FAD binding subunit
VDLVGPKAEDLPYRLEVAFESSVPAAVEAQATALLALLDGLDLSPQPSSRARGAGASTPFLREGRGQGVRLKCSVVLTEVVPWLAALEQAAAEAGLAAAWRAHAGHGLIFASLTGADDTLIVAVEVLRAAASAGQGSLVVLDAPPALAARLDMWGPSPALALMRRVKAQFDPHATLNPGRFLGRI